MSYFMIHDLDCMHFQMLDTRLSTSRFKLKSVDIIMYGDGGSLSICLSVCLRVSACESSCTYRCALQYNIQNI